MFTITVCGAFPQVKIGSHDLADILLKMAINNNDSNPTTHERIIYYRKVVIFIINQYRFDHSYFYFQFRDYYNVLSVIIQ